EHKKQKRRKCRACRFRRCVEEGMNPNAIVTDKRKLDLKDFSEKRQHLLGVPLKRIILSENRAFSSREELLYSECRIQLLRKSVHNFRPDCGFTMDSLLDKFTPMGTSSPEMPLLTNWSMTLMDIEYHLNNRVPLPVIDYNKYPSNFKFWFYMDLVYHMAWISSFDFFKTLERRDQKTIVKMVSLQLMILTTSYFSYRHKSSSCIFPDGSFFVWNTDHMFDVIRNCFEIELEEEEYVLIKMLLLCNPTWQQLSPATRFVLASVQRKFTSVLLDYCLVRFTHLSLNNHSEKSRQIG
ncbi:hypothetical protein PMAYCL1PPCAC_17452, partial [Pristionchus mayeri]